MSEKEIVLKIRAQEFPTTVKVIKAYPSDKLAWKPHDRSLSAAELIGRFPGEQMMAKMIMTKNAIAMEDFGAMPEMTLDQMVEQYEKAHAEVHSMMEATEESWWEQEVDFFGMKMPAKQAMWIGLLDGIHHRGQLSVYIRMAGGKVPSIYGPSADDNGGM